MKRIAILATIVAGGLAAAGLNAQGLPGIGATEKVSDNVYKIFGAGGNTTFFVRSDGVVLVDTKLANNGEAILAKVREVTDKPVTMIINTHSHPDHMGSNAEINTARGSVQIVAHANSATRMAQMPNTPKVTQTFTDKLTLGKGGDQIDLYWFGPAHTDGDAFVVFPKEKVMAAGDVMAWDMGLLVDPGSGGSMLGTADTVGKAVAGIHGVDKVIEGHGNVNTWDGFLRYLAYTRKVVDVAKRAVAENLNYIEAFDKYFATDPAMSPYIGEALKPGLEYGGTPKSRSLNNIFIAMMELRGEKPPLIMGAPPLPGQPLPTGPGGGGPRPAGGGGAPVDEHNHL
ncbi:MBL fold metallo-hydrolase [Croceibacterium sp. LX-88]|uniref:MBL fold metallo-hydrolase n=1 Tax=Croceibacterium selenioxidans TaxID=2838833 RepID=A0ABS5W7L5_9SPHN|nr:MBL fold metallo-hydrolase [Croceibacterium selenioxidans]MBT2135752.1 MBL fold metallo-hydrolase [Croceibacterium selenioxidans]